MNLRKSILALSVVAGIVAAPMTVFAAHTHSWGSPQYYGYEDEMPGMTGINVRHVMYIITNNV